MRLPENHSIRELGCHGLPDAHLPQVLTADIKGGGERRGCGGCTHQSAACLGYPRWCTRNSKQSFPRGEQGNSFSKDWSSLCRGKGSHWAWEPISSISLHSRGWHRTQTCPKTSFAPGEGGEANAVPEVPRERISGFVLWWWDYSERVKAYGKGKQHR